MRRRSFMPGMETPGPAGRQYSPCRLRYNIYPGFENYGYGVTDSVVPLAREPTFWRDDAIPFVEARAIDDGRKVRYGKHAHETFSIGIVTNGRCTYLHGRTRQHIGAGTVVLMTPGDAHACNPDRGGLWSYRMLYFDVAWLTGIQRDLGSRWHDRFRPFLETAT